MDKPLLDKIYTADEAAERLRLTNRGLIKIAKRHGHCSRSGRDYLFSEADLLALWQAMREPAAAPPTPLVRIVSRPGFFDEMQRKAIAERARKDERKLIRREEAARKREAAEQIKAKRRADREVSAARRKAEDA